MRRRDIIKLLGGAAASSFLRPCAARAQEREGTRRIGWLVSATEGSADVEARLTAFRETFQKLGWVSGRNIRIDVRGAAGDGSRLPSLAKELVGLSPDVIVTTGSPTTAAMQEATRTIPIVFVSATDPLGSGLVSSLAHPGGNVTGFPNYEFSIGGKWLESLKQIAPGINRVLVLIMPGNAGNAGLLHAIEDAAGPLGVQLLQSTVRDAAAIEAAFDASAPDSHMGLLVLPGGATTDNQELIIERAARHRVPAIYPVRSFALAGGLFYYGIDIQDLFRHAASYVDRILHGEKPGDLPVQQPTKFELVINLKTARTLGLAIPANLLALADEVIE